MGSRLNGKGMIIILKLVVGVGFEPTNARSGRIYSPHPLATWIPYQPKEIFKNNLGKGGKTILFFLISSFKT
jgi:hypothetical protein